MWRPRYEETDDGQKGGRNGQSKQTLIGARPPMFTGLPAMPTSLARWFLADETGEMLDFPVDIIKIGGRDSVRDGLTNDSHGPSTLIEPRHQHILDYVDTRGKGKKQRAGISCIQNGNRKESVELNEVGLHETLEAKCSVERRKNQRG